MNSAAPAEPPAAEQAQHGNRIHVTLESRDDPTRRVEIYLEPLNPPHLGCDDHLCECQPQYLSLSNAEARGLLLQLGTFFEQGVTQSVRSYPVVVAGGGGTVHVQPKTGRECPYLAIGACNKCGWADPALGGGTACCDLHGRNCEPPSELCCENCTEVHHGFWDGTRFGHLPGEICSNPDLSGGGGTEDASELEAFRDGYVAGAAAPKPDIRLPSPCGVPHCGILGPHEHTIYGGGGTENGDQ